VQAHHYHETKPQHYICPDHIMLYQYKGQQAKHPGPKYRKQNTDDPEPNTGSLELEQQAKQRKTDKQTQRRVNA